MNHSKIWKITACGLAAALAVGTYPVGINAAPGAGITSYTTSVVISSALPTAGFSLAMSQCAADATDRAIIASAQPVVALHEAPLVAESDIAAETSEYADLAVAMVEEYVNVRAQATTDSEVVGKLYKKNVCRVLGEEDGWYRIESGNVEGYIKGSYLAVGDEEKVKAAGRRVAIVRTDGLRIRKGPSTDTSVIDVVSEGEDLTVTDESVEGWVGVSVDGGNGYVSGEYVELDTEYTYAESRAEEKARLEREEEARRKAAAAKRSNQSSGGSSSYTPPTGSSGADVATFACQFVGNPYVYGGSSLTNGTDCSGFVMSVYSNFGVSLPHSSRSLRSSGYGVSTSNMQPGDIVCYSGHVGIYIGDGKIVHASNRRDGIKISNVSYRAILAVRRIF